jgi:DNA-binding NarL/FixJ family response regulator
MEIRPTKVLICDDHLVVRFGLRIIIEAMEGWSVCGEAVTGREASELAAKLKPDIVVLDMMMPEMNGLEATRQIKKGRPETEVMMFTGQETDELIKDAFEAGARSYILKTDPKHHIEAALRSLAQHKPYFTTHVGEVLFDRFLQSKKRVAADAGDGRLTDRERETVQLIAEGKSNKAVAGILGISVKTVETHRAAIMKKLKLATVSDLVRYAIRNHIIAA